MNEIDIDDLKIKYQELKEENVHLKRLISYKKEQDEKHMNLKENNKYLACEIKKLRVNINTYIQENTKLKSENSNFLKDISTRKQQEKQYERKIQEIKKKYEKIKQKAKEIYKRDQENTQENEKLKKEIINLKKKIEEFEKEKFLNIINDVQFGLIEQVKEIGRGAASVVYEVYKKEHYAMKVLLPEICANDDNDNDDDDDENIDYDKIKQFLFEYEILNKLNHPNIIKVFGFYMGDLSHTPSIILEFCPTNLKRCIKKLTDEERVDIIIQFCSAMKAVHSLGIIHRDLKLENILLDENHQVKLCDFGLCKLLSPEKQAITLTQVAGTIKYMAPELIQEKKDFDQKIDVYAFGVIFYQILRKGEFPAISIAEVGAGKIAPIPPTISVFSSNLIKDCWSCDPSERPTFESIYELLNENKNNIL